LGSKLAKAIVSIFYLRPLVETNGNEYLAIIQRNRYLHYPFLCRLASADGIKINPYIGF